MKFSREQNLKFRALKSFEYRAVGIFVRQDRRLARVKQPTNDNPVGIGDARSTTGSASFYGNVREVSHFSQPGFNLLFGCIPELSCRVDLSNVLSFGFAE